MLAAPPDDPCNTRTKNLAAPSQIGEETEKVCRKTCQTRPQYLLGYLGYTRLLILSDTVDTILAKFIVHQ